MKVDLIICKLINIPSLELTDYTDHQSVFLNFCSGSVVTPLNSDKRPDSKILP